MNIHIRANAIEITPAVDEYIRKKSQALEKYLATDSVADLYVEVSKTTGHHKSGEVFRSEFDLRTSLGQFRGEAEEQDLYAAIDRSKDEVLENFRSMHDKKKTLLRRGKERIKNIIRGISGRESEV
jgi:ribosomal subunit interface protein